MNGLRSTKNIKAFKFEGIWGQLESKKFLLVLTKFFIRNSEDFLSKIRHFTSISDFYLLLTADVVGLHPNVPYSVGLSALKSDLQNRKAKQIPTSDFLNMAELVLSNNCFEFFDKVYQQTLETAKSSPSSNACINMDKVETEFLKTRKLKPSSWLR